MKTPLRITCSHLDLSPVLEAQVRKHAARVERLCDSLTGCQVRIEAPRPWRSGDVYAVSIELTIPGGVIRSNSERPAPEHADVCVALRDAFENAARQLQQFRNAV